MTSSGTPMPAADWRVELTESAIDAVRALSRDEQSPIVSRIDRLTEGLPPSAHRSKDAIGYASLRAGDHILYCVEDASVKRIVVIAVRSAEERSAGAVMQGASEVLRRTMTATAGGAGMGSIAQDLRYTMRSLRRAPGFSAAAILTLALGIGATAAIFSVADGVLLEPLPYGDPEEVVTLWASWDNFPDKTWLSIPEYQLFHQENRTLEDLALYDGGSTSFTSTDRPERVRAASVMPNTFEVLGVAPVIGRAFTWEEAQDPNPGVLLSYETWQRRYAGDAGILDRSVQLDGAFTPVLGVLPEGFVLPTDYASTSVTEVFYPMYVDIESPAPDLGTGGSHGWYGVGRLRDGVTIKQARSDLARIMAGVEPLGLYSAERRFTPRLYAAKADIVGSARVTILILLGAVAFVLLIACGNVANLLLSRSDQRLNEVAVRTAMGASRGRILRQLLTESVVMAAVAGVLGYGLAYAGVAMLLSIDPNAVPRSGSVALDWPVVLFTVTISLATSILFGAVPALRVSRAGIGTTLREGGRSDGGTTTSSRTQGLLVAAQMAMAVILLTGAGLMMRSFVSLLRIDPGFSAEDVLTLRVNASQARYPDPATINIFYSQLLQRLRDTPGIVSAGAARLLPLASTMGDSFLRPVGYQPGPNESTQGDWQWATPGYIESMGIPILEGRAFDERDRRDGQPVILINEVVARRYFGDESALGRAMLASGAADTAIVVGVVGNVSHNGITTDAKTRYYVPHAQVHEDWTGTTRTMTLTIATDGDPLGFVDLVRREVRAMDATVALSEVRTLDDVLSSSVAQPRFAMVLLATFAAVAIALAIVGIYGVIAYGVSRRTREIGIRMALGAGGGQVIRLVVRQGMLMAVVGVTIGIAAAWFLTGLMSGLLYGVTPQDPTTFLSVPAAFVAVALAACLIPAARASRVRPASALRYE